MANSCPEHCITSLSSNKTFFITNIIYLCTKVIGELTGAGGSLGQPRFLSVHQKIKEDQNCVDNMGEVYDPFKVS